MTIITFDGEEAIKWMKERRVLLDRKVVINFEIEKLRAEYSGCVTKLGDLDRELRSEVFFK